MAKLHFATQLGTQKPAIVSGKSGKARFLELSALKDLAGGAVSRLLRKHLAATDLVEDGTMVRLWSVRETRKAFSAEKLNALGVRLFAPSQGAHAETALIVMSLKDLVEILEVAQERTSIVAALAPTEDLPVAAELRIAPGRRGPGPKLQSATEQP